MTPKKMLGGPKETVSDVYTSKETSQSLHFVRLSHTIDKIVVLVRLHTSLDRVQRKL